MNKISSQNLTLLPSAERLKEICKSIAALEAIICPDWHDRYYSFQNKWSATEAVFEMRNGEGDQMLILFRIDGVIINGFAHESKMNGWKTVQKPIELNFLQKLFSKQKFKSVVTQQIWNNVIDSVPTVFNEFIYGEPVKTIGTTFCIWQLNPDSNWQIGNINFPKDEFKDGSAEILIHLDGNPASYHKWASAYYDQIYLEQPQFVLEVRHIEAVYNQAPITKDLVLKINPLMDDFEKLKLDLEGIGYPHKL